MFQPGGFNIQQVLRSKTQQQTRKEANQQHQLALTIVPLTTTTARPDLSPFDALASPPIYTDYLLRHIMLFLLVLTSSSLVSPPIYTNYLLCHVIPCLLIFTSSSSTPSPLLNTDFLFGHSMFFLSASFLYLTLLLSKDITSFSSFL